MYRGFLLVPGILTIVAAFVLGANLLGPDSSGLSQGEDEGEFRLVVPQLAKDEAPPTHTPSATPTSPPTSTPTATASPTNTPTPSTVRVRSNVTSYYSSTGSLWIVGEVVNGLNRPVGLVEVTARFYSGSDTLLDTDFTFADVSTIPAGGDSPFALIVLDPQPGIARYEIQVSDYSDPPFSPVVSGISAEVSNSFISSTGTLHDVGTVTNSSDSTYEFVEIIIAYYNAAGDVIRVDFTFADPDTLSPGQSGTFEVLVFDADELDIASRRIWVDANLP